MSKLSESDLEENLKSLNLKDSLGIDLEENVESPFAEETIVPTIEVLGKNPNIYEHRLEEFDRILVIFKKINSELIGKWVPKRYMDVGTIKKTLKIVSRDELKDVSYPFYQDLGEKILVSVWPGDYDIGLAFTRNFQNEEDIFIILAQSIDGYMSVGVKEVEPYFRLLSEAITYLARNSQTEKHIPISEKRKILLK